MLTAKDVEQVVRYGEGLSQTPTPNTIRLWIRRGVLVPAPAIGRELQFYRSNVMTLLGAWDWTTGRLRIVRAQGAPAAREARKQERIDAILKLMRAYPSMSARQIGIRIGVGWSTLTRYIDELRAESVVSGGVGEPWVVHGRPGGPDEHRREQYLDLLAELQPDAWRVLVGPDAVRNAQTAVAATADAAAEVLAR